MVANWFDSRKLGKSLQTPLSSPSMRVGLTRLVVRKCLLQNKMNSALSHPRSHSFNTRRKWITGGGLDKVLRRLEFSQRDITTLQVANTNCEPNEVVKVMGYEGDKRPGARRSSIIMLTD